MPNYRRVFVGGGCWFFTVNLEDRRSGLLTEHIDALRAAVAKVRRRQAFDINAWVVLPDHMHAIWTLPPEDTDFPTRWRLIKAFFARSLPATEWRSEVHKARRERGIWQRRYWEHLVRDEKDCLRHLHYCYFNPVKHGLVANVEDWPYSTFSFWRVQMQLAGRSLIVGEWPFSVTNQMAITEEQLLGEIEDLLRTAPQIGRVHDATDENFSWLGRASAALHAWNPIRGATGVYLTQIRSDRALPIQQGYTAILTLLHEARHDLRMKTVGPLSVAIPHGGHFDYFDEIRKVIVAARLDLFFVDVYLDAEFVSRYLVHVAKGVPMRLLGRKYIATLVPAVEAFAKQTQQAIEVRSAPNFHDRFVFVDGGACYQSGASFKDGAKTAPTTLTQITDAFTGVKKTYEDIWSSAKVEGNSDKER